MFRKLGAILVAAVVSVVMAASPAVAADEHWYGYNGNQGSACGGKSFVLNAHMFRFENSYYTDSIDFSNNGDPSSTWVRASNTNNVDWVKLQVRKVDTSGIDVLVNERVKNSPDSFGDFPFNPDEIIPVTRTPYLKAIVKWDNGDQCSAKLSWKHNWEG